MSKETIPLHFQQNQFSEPQFKNLNSNQIEFLDKKKKDKKI